MHLQKHVRTPLRIATSVQHLQGNCTCNYYKNNLVQLCKREAICNYVPYIKIISSDRVAEYLVVIVL